jgi:hypothetical protein
MMARKGAFFTYQKLLMLYERISAAYAYLQLAADMDMQELPLLQRNIRELARQAESMAEQALELADAVGAH